MRAWLLLLLLVPAVTGLAVCQSVWAAPSAAPPCATATCPPVQVTLPPPPAPTPPKAWAGITRREAITEFHKLINAPSRFRLPGLRAVHANCETFEAWKVWVPKHTARWYIIDERTKGYWVTPYAPAAGCHP